VTGSFFLDSSALIKLYHEEPGTERVEEIFATSETSLVVSELAAVELQSALARKVRTGEIT
jgi:predicted nucleic acid-binding protein